MLGRHRDKNTAPQGVDLGLSEFNRSMWSAPKNKLSRDELLKSIDAVLLRSTGVYADPYSRSGLRIKVHENCGPDHARKMFRRVHKLVRDNFNGYHENPEAAEIWESVIEISVAMIPKLANQKHFLNPEGCRFFYQFVRTFLDPKLSERFQSGVECAISASLNLRLESLGEVQGRNVGEERSDHYFYVVTYPDKFRPEDDIVHILLASQRSNREPILRSLLDMGMYPRVTGRDDKGVVEIQGVLPQKLWAA